MAKRRFGIIVLLLCFCLCMLSSQTFAASTTEAKEPISVNEECSLTIAYSYEGISFSNQSVKLYKVADVSADYQYTLASAFASSGLALNGVQTNDEWNTIRETLEAYILVNDIEPVASAVTDETGKNCFDALKPGLYLTSAVYVEQENVRCAFGAALVALPGLGTDGLWQYQVAVTAKPESLPPIAADEEIEWKVLKLWKGDEGRNDRPKHIDVEIFRDGVRYSTIALSEENHWSYSWAAKADGADWKVVEKDVPSGYTMTVLSKESTFVLTNTRISEAVDNPTSQPPKTGDTANILLYTALMSVSGIVLLILGIVRKRKHHEETN